jgi:hypothetical protein
LNHIIEFGLNCFIKFQLFQELFSLRNNFFDVSPLVKARIFFLRLVSTAIRYPGSVFEADAVVGGQDLIGENYSIGVPFNPRAFWHVVNVASLNHDKAYVQFGDHLFGNNRRI